MANGAAVRLPVEIEPPSAPTAAPAKCLSKDIPAGATKGKPGAAPAATEIETRIGEAAAKCAIAISQGIADFAAGGAMAPMTRLLGAEYLAQLAQLRIDTFGKIDFATVAQREGRRVLFQRHGADLRQQLGANMDPVALAKTLADLIDMAVTIAQKVARDELAYLRARAN